MHPALHTLSTKNQEQLTKDVCAGSGVWCMYMLSSEIQGLKWHNSGGKGKGREEC